MSDIDLYKESIAGAAGRAAERTAVARSAWEQVIDLASRSMEAER